VHELLPPNTEPTLPFRPMSVRMPSTHLQPEWGIGTSQSLHNPHRSPKSLTDEEGKLACSHFRCNTASLSIFHEFD
ncbi:hypothetical protein GOODEAATRI_029392, partial [Goodea atripinnis]